MVHYCPIESHVYSIPHLLLTLQALDNWNPVVNESMFEISFPRILPPQVLLGLLPIRPTLLCRSQSIILFSLYGSFIHCTVASYTPYALANFNWRRYKSPSWRGRRLRCRLVLADLIVGRGGVSSLCKVRELPTVHDLPCGLPRASLTLGVD
jgi:hypothetical protein